MALSSARRVSLFAQFLNLPLFQVIILMQPGIGKSVFIQRECKFTVKKQRKSAFLCLFDLR